MIGAEIRPGLWRWRAYHPTWKEIVGCVALRGEGEWALIDPLLEAEQWEALPQERLHILLTTHWHGRSAAEIAARRPDCRVWAQSRNVAAVRRRVPVTDVYRVGDPLPAGLAARQARPRTEVLFWSERHRALIAGDALLGGDGGVRLTPASWLPGSATLEQLRAELRPLLELPVERILVSHGEPVLSGGRAALAAALG